VALVFPEVIMPNGPSSKPPLLPAVRKLSRQSRIAVAGVLLLALASLAAKLFLQAFRVPTGAMQPTLMGSKPLPDGSRAGADHFFAEKFSLLFRAPARGDIVVFRTEGIDHPQVPQDQIFIKRVVGIPGDKLIFEPPGVRVNNQMLTHPEIFRKIAARTNGHCGYSAMGDHGVSHEITLGENEYFVAGDNSQNSLDSRYFGPIQRKQIFGRAFFIYYPWQRIGFVD
jgi:signal peptidase I